MAAVLLVTAICVMDASAQTSRASVSASEGDGTFRYYFAGKYNGSSNEIKILALGKGKLKVAFDLIYPFTDGAGESSANLGQATGVAEIVGDTAVYRSEEDGTCRIMITFVKPGKISVDQSGDCGFGHNVTARGTYTRTSKLKPTFESNE